MKRYIRASSVEDDENFIVKDGYWKLWQPLTYDGFLSLAKQGSVGRYRNNAFYELQHDSSIWGRYISRGPCYVFIHTLCPECKYLFHFELKHFCEQYGFDDGLEGFYRFIKDKPNFLSFFGNLYNFEIIQDCLIEDNTIVKYIGESKKQSADLSNLKVTEIGADAFRRCTLWEVKLPDGLKEIGIYAFANCSCLTKINFPPSLQNIGRYAFLECRSLKQISRSDNPITIGEYAFYGCKSLSKDDQEALKSPDEGPMGHMMVSYQEYEKMKHKNE